MGPLAQARLSQSKPSGGCLDAKCWCLTVMRYKVAFREYLKSLTSVVLTHLIKDCTHILLAMTLYD